MRLYNRSLLALAFLAAGTMGAFAVPARKGIIEMPQPDGTVLPVRLLGDERQHVTLTTDGYLLLSGADKFMEYATLDSDGLPIASGIRANAVEARTAAETSLLAGLDKQAVINASASAARTRAIGDPHRYAFDANNFPNTGEPHGIVVLVEYADVKFSMDDPHDYFSRMLNEEGFSDNKGTGSARDFFVYNSNGIFKPTFDVYGPIKLSQNRAYYGGNDFNGNDLRPEEMIIEACDELFNNQGITFDQYCHNEDMEIDNVFVIYAGKGEASSGVKESVWPHSADLKDAGMMTRYGNVYLNRYGCSNELKYNGKPDGIGTFVHEFSHVIGLPDLYHTMDPYAEYTPGSWSAMDAGPYNNDGNTPPNFSSFERYSLNWIEPIKLTDTGNYTLENLAESNVAYMITTDREDEFFLLENRQQVGNDYYIPGHGMLVWHIDFWQKKWDQNVVNNTKKHQYVDIVEADGTANDTSRDGDSFPGRQNVTELTYDTKPALQAWSNEPTDFSIYDIAENDGKISFRAVNENAAPGSVAQLVTSAGTVLKVNGNQLTASCAEASAVYGINGTLHGYVSASSPLTLPAGVYAVILPEGARKIIVR